MIFGADLYREDVNKISFILNTYQDHIDATKHFSHLKSGTWGGAGETALFGGLGVSGIDKGVAIDCLLEHIGASIEDTIAFGDAKVDIPMFEKCNFGVAVASGGEEIKAAADYVTDAVNEDGLYHAFEYLQLI
jgi:hydroxymethylpyrimidine pyrophosphatase-like HAD family hydrolase